MASLAFGEKVSKFKAILKDYDDSIGDPGDMAILNKILFIPIVIDHCNGVGPWSFNDATIDYRKFSGLPLYLWFSDSIMKIIAELRNQKALDAKQKKAFENLMDFFIFSSEKHLICLKTILKGNRTETEVQAILAVHYFQPLVHGCSYAIDKNKRRNLKCCPLCKEKVIFEDTSFGNRKVWHGNADIVLRKSVLKVDYTRSDEDSDLDDQDVNAVNIGFEEDAGDEPSVKQRRKDSDSGSSSGSFINILEVKPEKQMKKKANSQALAQTIVNAFCEAKKDRSLMKQFIPSFMVTEKEIRMIMYNCDYDMLLFGQKLQIWHTSSCLNISTILYVWLQLNFDKFDNKIAGNVLDKLPKSSFKEYIGNDTYKIYSEEVTRPLPETKGKTKIRPEVCCSDKIMSNYGGIMQNLTAAALDIYSGL